MQKNDRLELTTSNAGIQGSRYLVFGTWAQVPGLGLTTSNPGIQGSRYLGLGTWLGFGALAGADDAQSWHPRHYYNITSALRLIGSLRISSVPGGHQATAKPRGQAQVGLGRAGKAPAGPGQPLPRASQTALGCPGSYFI